MNNDPGNISSRFQILYEDNHLISVVKPAGILSQSDGSGAEDMITLLSDDIARRRGKPGRAFVGLIHRLDRNVGGTMFFAKTSKGASRASEDMRTGNFYKGYLALTAGWLAGEEGWLRHRLEKDAKQNRVFPSEQGRDCILYYKRLCGIPESGELPERTVYFAVPVTGRAHQIRAQFALSGAPLLGDNKYGTGMLTRRHELGLWSALASVRKTVDRGERIWVNALPDGAPWHDGDGKLPGEAEAFICSDTVKTLLPAIKSECGFGGDADD